MVKRASLIFITALFTSCSIPARDELGQRRVSEQEIQEITPLIHKRLYHSPQTITRFAREDTDAIDVWTTDGTIYVVRKVDHQWKIVDVTGVEY